MRYGYLSAFTFLIYILSSHVASAHVIETDGDIQGVMHISPAHEPTATEPAHFEFFLKDTRETFDPNSYTYSLTITGEGMATTTVPVMAHGSVLFAEYTFTQEGNDYTATLTGSSSANSQPSFDLDFDDIKVLPKGQHEDPIGNLFEQHGAHVLLVAIILLAFAGIVAWDRLVVRRVKVQPSPNENP
ncbi:MAG TPA: hypothetical protein VN086_00315 [Candidatus Paceibacterota bacterium]|nr:hypothetical protein [Candidatus Paceibacterota bacterium]